MVCHGIGSYMKHLITQLCMMDFYRIFLTLVVHIDTRYNEKYELLWFRVLASKLLHSIMLPLKFMPKCKQNMLINQYLTTDETPIRINKKKKNKQNKT